MNNEWIEVNLGDYCKVKGGKRLPKGERLTSTSNNHPYIRVKDMGKGKTINLNEDFEYIDESVYKIISNYTVNKDDIIISIVGTVGLVSIVGQSLDGANLTENCVKLTDLKDFDKDFIYYYLTSMYGKNEIDKGIVGSTQPKFPIYNIKKLSINKPPLEEQKVIAKILSPLDEKIELNNQINKTLEEIAQTIFKHWFVDFEFPNEDGEPYKSSGGEMVESELGMIPMGWGVKSIRDLTEVVSKGTTPKKIDLDNAKDKKIIKFIKVRDISVDGIIEKSNLEYIPQSIHLNVLKRSILNYKDILISIAGTIGRISYVNKHLINSNINQAIAFIRLKEVEKHFLLILYNLKSNEFQESIKSKIVQGVQANISLTVINNEKLVIPADSILRLFNTTIYSIHAKKEVISSENMILKKLRDTLLPKLMSGEIRVPLNKESLL